MTLRQLVGSVCTLLSVSVSSALACSSNGSDGFMPENKMSYPVSTFSVQSVRESEFNAVIDRATTYYSPLIRARGGNLRIERLWSNPKVNASAHREGDDYVITMYGGMARHPKSTPDSFALVLCHEFGHHLGGSPTYTGSDMASEGQADYFAASKCMRRVFNEEDNVSIVRGLNVPSSVATRCQKSFPRDSNESAICQRTAMAAQALGEILAEGGQGPIPSLSTSDRSVVSSTLTDEYPGDQCRVDTYVNGANCRVDYTQDFDPRDPTIGACAQERGQYYGVRPLCWYKPRRS